MSHIKNSVSELFGKKYKRYHSNVQTKYLIIKCFFNRTLITVISKLGIKIVTFWPLSYLH